MSSTVVIAALALVVATFTDAVSAEPAFTTKIGAAK
jgi:hypothetical protein